MSPCPGSISASSATPSNSRPGCAGKTVELRERDKVIGHIVPAAALVKKRVIPDFAAMRKEIIGDRILPGADLLIEEREKSRY